jgi:hypothetical protein
MHQRRSIRRRTLAALVASLLLLGACSSGSGGDTGQQTGGAAGSGDPLDLRGVCPSTIVVQTSWTPIIESWGALYALLGPNPQIDAKKKRVTAPLTTTAQHKDTGVKLELRAGGPATGFEKSTVQLYSDRSINFAVPSGFDELIQLSKTQPTTAVVALADIDAQMIMWDPQKHPQWNIIADIGQTNARVLYFGGDTYMEYLIGSGILKKSQVDGSYDGSPARFVAEQGEIAQSGYATAEPYIFEKDLKNWGKPVKFQLVYDTGYPNYGATLTMRARDKEKLTPCLKKLVPIIQQAQVDVRAKPDQTIPLVVQLNDDYKTGVPYPKGLAEFAASQERNLGLTGNGAPRDNTIGNFDMARVQKMIDITGPIFAAQKKPIKDGLKPSDMVTNEFLNMNIGVKGS